MLYRSPSSEPRRGLVLVAVLVVVSVLALAAYQYSEFMSAEYRGASSSTKVTQTRGFAIAGVNYVAGILSDPNYFTTTLSSNPYDNDSIFRDVVVQQGDTPAQTGYFSIIAILSPDDPNFQQQPWRFGVTDEASKINVNALLQYSKSGTAGSAMLLALPNMTQDIANSLLDWVDSASTSPRSGGAKDDFYPGLQPPYHVKNGPLDSLDELLNVQTMTTDLLWGNDLNFNGQVDPGEVGGSNGGAVDLGLAPYLTLYSRENNHSSTGAARVYLNDPSLTTLQTNLTAIPGMSTQLTNFWSSPSSPLCSAASSGGGSGGGVHD